MPGLEVTTSQDGVQDLFQAIYSQRAIRRFKPDPVPDELLWQVLEAGTKAPSGSNSQPWGFVVVRDEAKRQAIGAMLREYVAGNEEFRAYLANVDSLADASQRRMMRGARQLFEHLEDAPVMIIPCLYQSTSPAPEGLMAGSSIYPSIQNMLLAARGLGLGTVLTTFQAMFDQPLRELLHLPDDATPAALIPLGFPDAKFGPTSRKPVESIVHWDEWGQQRDR